MYWQKAVRSGYYAKRAGTADTPAVRSTSAKHASTVGSLQQFVDRHRDLVHVRL